MRADAGRPPAARKSCSCGRALLLRGTSRARTSRAAGRVPPCNTSAAGKVAWIQTSNQAVLTAAVESGISHVLFTPDTQQRAEQWARLAAFEPLQLQPDTGAITDASQQQVGRLLVVSSAADLQAAMAAAAAQPGFLVMDATDWKVIPAENMVAVAQAGPGRLLGVASSAADARVLLEALEVGTAGVLLRTEDPLQVKQLAAYLTQRAAEGAPSFSYETATVTRVAPVGMGDRVCVDLCSLLVPGEGLLVGSFSRGLFLVHSECMDSDYINSRPFRVNAGAVHAYLQVPGGRTAYLSELCSGMEVLVGDAAGRTRTAIVGRCKVEVRPMVLVEAETADGVQHSTLLQNAETVRLVGLCSGSGSSSSEQPQWQAVSVSVLQPGQQLYLLRQEGARHTGISIQERISEK